MSRVLTLATGLLLGLALLHAGCVRFNTYYNARRAFRDAETLAAQRGPGSSPSAQEVAHLDRCLEKCAVIIARHADSGLADDALFLMARALSLKGQDNAAAEKYAELRRFFPASDLTGPARYYEAQARSRLMQYDRAEAIIEEHLGLRAKWDRWQHQAALLYAEIGERRGSCADALSRVDALLSRTRERDIAAPAYLLKGRCLAATGHGEEAVAAFQEAERIAPRRHLRFTARLLMGETLAALGRSDEALGTFKRLQEFARADSELASVGLAVGTSQRIAGNLTAAEEAWRNVIAAYPREETSRHARMALATMLERDRRDLKAALTEYEDLSKQGSPRALVEEAGRRAKALRDVERLRAAIAESSEVAPETLMTLAELYLLRVELPDSALPLLLHVCSRYADRPCAARALYAAAWVSALHGDSAVAESLSTVLVEKHPHSAHARAVRARRGELPPEDSAVGTPAWLYRRGEDAWLQDRAPERALAAFAAVVDSFPDAPEAAKALVAMAWVKSEAYHDTVQARAHLQGAADRYPQTDVGRWASLATGVRTTKREYDQPPSVVKIDTVVCAEIAPVDSTSRLGTVMVRVLVDTTGTAREVELVKGTGGLLCDDAALGAARTAEYASAQKDSARVQAWLDVGVPFIPARRDSAAGPSEG